jgi:hypothetical protein
MSKESMQVSTVKDLPESLLSFGLPYDKSRTESIMTSAGKAFRVSQDRRLARLGHLQRHSPVVIDYRHHDLLLGPLRPGT